MPKIVVPKRLRCSITGRLMEEPVFILNSQEKEIVLFYEEKSLETWFHEHHQNPETKEKITYLNWDRATALKQEINQFLIDQKVCTKETFLEIFLTGEVEALEALNYLESYIEICHEGESLLHIAVKLGNKGLVEWLLERGCDVHARNKDGLTAMQIVEQQKTDQSIINLLILHGAEHLPLNEKELRKLLSHQMRVRMSILDEGELYSLSKILRDNETLCDLELTTCHLNQILIDELEGIFKENTTLCRFEVKSDQRSYSNLFQHYINKNKQRPRGLYFYEDYLSSVGVKLSQLFVEEQDPYLIQQKTAKLINDLIFQLPLKSFQPSVREACYGWVIYLLSQEVPCLAYRILINRAFEGLMNGLSLEDLRVQHLDVMVWSEKEFKSAYLKIQKKYQKYLEKKKIKWISLEGPVSEEDYRECIKNLKLSLMEKGSYRYAVDCLGTTRARLILEGFVPFYLEEKESNAKQVFSWEVNKVRALQEAKKEKLLSPENDQLIIDLPEFPGNEIIERTNIWMNRFDICTSSTFLSVLKEGDLQKLKSLHYLDYYLEKDLVDDFPICIAAESGYWDIMKWLVEEGVEINVIGKEHKSPLDWVFHYGNIEMAEWLMTSHSIDVSLPNTIGNIPVWVAYLNNQIAMLDWLMKQGASIQIMHDHYTLLQIVIREVEDEVCLDRIIPLVKRGIDINAQGFERNTALHFAVRYKKFNVVKYLVDQGANIHIKNQENVTPLIYAQRNNLIEIVDFLIPYVLQGAEHDYLDKDQYKKLLLKAQTAKLKLPNEKALQDLAEILVENKTLIHLELEFRFWSDVSKGLLISAVEHNKSLLHFSITGINSSQMVHFEPYIRRNRITHEVKCILPYQSYLKTMGIPMNRIFTTELKDLEGSQYIVDIIRLVVFGLPFEKMEPNLSQSIQKASYEWIIYLLANTPLNKEYAELLKMAFLFLLQDANPVSYSEKDLHTFIERKDLWVWSESYFKEVYLSIQKHFPNALIKIDLKGGVDFQVYDICLSQIITLIQNQPEVIECFKEKEIVDLLKLGFKPLYLNCMQQNAKLVFQDRFNHWRSKEFRWWVSLEAEKKGFLCQLSGDLIENPVVISGEDNIYERSWIEPLLEESDKKKLIVNAELKNKILRFQHKYQICNLKTFWNALAINGLEGLSQLNYLESYFFSLNEVGDTLVHLAVRKKDRNLIDFLAENGCRLDISNQEGVTPLHLAINNNDKEMIFYFLKRIGRPLSEFVENVNGPSLLHFAVSADDLEMITFLIDNGLNWNRNARDSKGRTIMDVALEGNKIKIIYWLVKNWGPEIHYFVSKTGDSLFHFAISTNDLDLIDLLFENECRLNFPNANGVLPLQLAFETGNRKLIFFLLDRVGKSLSEFVEDKEGPSLMHYAAKTGDIELAICLLNNGLNWNRKARDSEGKTVLDWVLVNKNQDIVFWFIENLGSDFFLEVSDVTLNLMVKQGFLERVSLLIQLGYSFDFQDQNGFSPLHTALKYGHLNNCLNIANLLIENGCNIEVKDETGQTPLIYAKKLLKKDPRSTFWYKLIVYGAQHDSLTENQLIAILRNETQVTLSISDPDEFRILASLLKQNAFPYLNHLNLKLYNDTFDYKLFSEALESNKVLTHLTVEENHFDFSNRIEPMFERIKKGYETIHQQLGKFIAKGWGYKGKEELANFLSSLSSSKQLTLQEKIQFLKCRDKNNCTIGMFLENDQKNLFYKFLFLSNHSSHPGKSAIKEYMALLDTLGLDLKIRRNLSDEVVINITLLPMTVTPGLTALSRRYVYDRYEDYTPCEIGVSFDSCSLVWNGIRFRLQIRSSSTNEKFYPFLYSYFRSTDIFLQCIPINQITEGRDWIGWEDAIKRYGSNQKSLLVITQMDLFENGNYSELMRNKACQIGAAGYYTCSSKTGVGVKELFQKAVELFIEDKLESVIYKETSQTFLNEKTEQTHQDMTPYFEKFIQRNQWIKRLEPYEYSLKSIGVSFDQLFSEGALSTQLIPEIISEFLNKTLLQLPLEKFSREDAQACCHWIIHLLAGERFKNPFYISLIQGTLEKLFLLQGQDYLLSEKTLDQWIDYLDVLIWSEEDFGVFIKHFQQNLQNYLLFVKAIKMLFRL